MSISRTWNLRLNLDEFNALAASLYADADRALALQGMSLGINGGKTPSNAPPAFSRGWELGHRMRAEAEAFRAAQSGRGQKSAAKRLERTGSSQPQRQDAGWHNTEPPFEPPFEREPEPSHEPSAEPGFSQNHADLQISRTEAEPPFEPPFDQWIERGDEPNHNPQSTILKTKNQKSTTPENPDLTLPPRATPPKPTAAPGWGAVKPSPNPTPRHEPHQPVQEPPQAARNPLATDPAQAEEERRHRWSQRRQEWLETQGGQVDFTVQPGRLLWRSYCRVVHPSWQERCVDKAHATISLHNWSQGGRKIESWWQVADAWAKNADHTEYFEAFMDGSMGIDASALSASAKGITEGEGFS